MGGFGKKRVAHSWIYVTLCKFSLLLYRQLLKIVAVDMLLILFPIFGIFVER